MNRIVNFKAYLELNEVKSERKIVQDLARHLAFDKDVIKYLNSPRSKRDVGWRDLLKSKLHGNNLDYVNYITKNMVADYNPQITGFVNISAEGDFDNDKSSRKNGFGNFDVADKINQLDTRVSNVENVLGINPDDEETLNNVKDKLKEVGYEPDWIPEEGDEDEPIDDIEEE